MFSLPSYKQVLDSGFEENSFYEENDKVKLITSTTSYDIPRKNFVKVRNSIFGLTFIKEHKDEFNWTHSDRIIEQIVVNLLINKGINSQLKLPRGTTEEKIYILNELEKLGLREYFETTTLGNNWKILLSFNSYYNDVLTNNDLCNKTGELLVRALNRALESNIFKGEFEITNNGKIALNGKDITRDVIHLNGKNEDFIDDNNLLINICLYCDINKYWNKVYQAMLGILFTQDISLTWQKDILIKEPVCYSKTNNCCYQSTFHKHFKYDLTEYINYIIN